MNPLRPIEASLIPDPMVGQVWIWSDGFTATITEIVADRRGGPGPHDHLVSIRWKDSRPDIYVEVYPCLWPLPKGAFLIESPEAIGPDHLWSKEPA